MNEELQKIKEELSTIKARNKRVELDKAWETSWMRRIIIAIMTYALIVIFMLVTKLEKPFVSAIIPTVAYLISASALPILKQWWIKRSIKKGFISVTTLLVLFLATPFIGSSVIAVQTADQIYSKVDEVPQKELALVLGAAAYGNRLSDVLRDRVDTAIGLYKAEKVSVLVMSGAQNEVEAMKNYAIEQNVPAEAITTDAYGLNTMASVNNIAELGRSTTIITQKYHLPRALFIANTQGIDAAGLTADKQEYLKIAEFKKREILATSKAILDIFVLD